MGVIQINYSTNHTPKDIMKNKLIALLLLLVLPLVAFSQFTTDSGIILKEHEETLFIKSHYEFNLNLFKSESYLLRGGVGVEFREESTVILIPLFVVVKSGILESKAGGEFVGKSWCSMVTAGINLSRINFYSGIRIGDFNEWVLGVGYNFDFKK